MTNTKAHPLTRSVMDAIMAEHGINDTQYDEVFLQFVADMHLAGHTDETELTARCFRDWIQVRTSDGANTATDDAANASASATMAKTANATDRSCPYTSVHDSINSALQHVEDAVMVCISAEMYSTVQCLCDVASRLKELRAGAIELAY